MGQGDGTQLRHGRHRVGGIALHVVEAGPEDGPAVLLLHGFPEFWWGWRGQISALAAAGHRVVVPDGRGVNLSDKPDGIEPYRLDRLAGDVVGLADALGIGHFRLAGHDWGGVVAWAAAALHPARVERLAVLNAPHPDTWGPYARRHPSQALRSLYVGLFQLPRLPEALLGAGNFRALRRSLLESSRPGTFSPADLDRYAEAWARPGALTATLNWYRALRFFAARALPRVEAETLVLWGVEDRFLERGLAAEAAARCRSATVRYVEATHWLHHEQPEAVGAALVEHFAASGSLVRTGPPRVAAGTDRETTMAQMVWDSPAVVRWSPEMSSEQIGNVGKDAEARSFPELRAALNFVIEELQATPRMNVGVYPERGSALINLAMIEQAYRSHPTPDGEPGGAV